MQNLRSTGRFYRAFFAKGDHQWDQNKNIENMRFLRKLFYAVTYSWLIIFFVYQGLIYLKHYRNILLKRRELEAAKTGEIWCSGFKEKREYFEWIHHHHQQRHTCQDLRGIWTVPSFFSGSFRKKNKINKLIWQRKMNNHWKRKSYMRSGSSFLGEFFNEHSDVFYQFEPLHPHNELCKTDQPRCIINLARTMKCQFKDRYRNGFTEIESEEEEIFNII